MLTPAGYRIGPMPVPIRPAKYPVHPYWLPKSLIDWLCRVIVMPHSHNDPGWLKTVEGYFATATRNILNNVVNKLTTYTNMTFIWSEVHLGPSSQ